MFDQARNLYPTMELSSERQKLHRGLIGLAVASACLCPIVLPFDLQSTRWIVNQGLPGDFRKAIELSEVFAHGVGVTLILLLMGTLAPHTRWALPRLGIMAFGGGAIATLTKLIVIRERPYHFNLETAPANVVWQFIWDWQLDNLAVYDAAWRSFPSGHAATAFGLAIGLGLVFPRGRGIFMAIGVMSMVQRVAEQAHYPSDVFAGITIGALWTLVCVHPNLLGGIFSQIEPSGTADRVQAPETEKTVAVPPTDEQKPFELPPRRNAA